MFSCWGRKTGSWSGGQQPALQRPDGLHLIVVGGVLGLRILRARWNRSYFESELGALWFACDMSRDMIYMFIIVWEHVWYCIHFKGTKNLALALEFGSSLYISIYFDMGTNPLFRAKLKKTRTIAGWCGLWHHFQGWLNTPIESPTVRVVDECLLNADVSEPDVCFGGCISVIGRSYQILVVPFCLSNASMMPWRQGWSLEVTERFSVWRRSDKFAVALLLCQGCQQWLFDALGRFRMNTVGTHISEDVSVNTD